ncbi:mitochondrial carrier [Clavulina sp. PMI_390]|nr:mitochondrial carrier [Clavulina sp. PMI_390]
MLEQPFILAQTRIQSEVLSVTRRFRGPVDCLRSSWRLGGLSSLYRGFVPGMLSAAIGPIIALRAYTTVFRDLAHLNPKLFDKEGELPWMYETAVMMCAQGSTTWVITPLELLARRRHIQALPPPPPLISMAESLPPSSVVHHAISKPSSPGAWSMARTIWQQEGFRGLYRGHNATMLRQGLGIPLAFAISNPVERMLKAQEFSLDPPQSKRKLLPWEDAIVGATYGLTYACIATPFDCVKTLTQTEGAIHSTSQPSLHRTFRHTFAEVYKARGVRGLYTGFSMAAPRMTVVMALDWVLAGLVDRAGIYD